MEQLNEKLVALQLQVNDLKMIVHRNEQVSNYLFMLTSICSCDFVHHQPYKPYKPYDICGFSLRLVFQHPSLCACTGYSLTFIIIEALCRIAAANMC